MVGLGMRLWVMLGGGRPAWAETFAGYPRDGKIV